jgi:hypothetical protein
LLRVLDENINHKLGFAMLLSQVRRLLKVSSLPTHGDGGVEVKLEVAGRLDELFELLDVFELGIAVQQEGRVICRRLSVFVELFEVLDKVVDALCVEELNS